jgi:hypothetical protein
MIQASAASLKAAAYVRFGSLADVRTAKSNVRFTLESGHVRCTSLRLLWANSGHSSRQWMRVLSFPL